MMPRAALEKVEMARGQMLEAEQKLRDFLDQRGFTPVENEERKRLAQHLRSRMDQYLETLLEACEPLERERGG